MMVNYQGIREAIARRQSFKGNSCKGLIDNEGVYRIISYVTEVYNSKEGLNLTYYSVITSKLQGIIGEAIYGKSLKELRGEKEKKSQKIDYSQLYYDKEIKAAKEGIASGRPIELDIKINDFNFRPDCQIGHFGYNFFCRTNAGINLKRYTTRARLQKAVENRLKKEGFAILEWIDK